MLYVLYAEPIYTNYNLERSHDEIYHNFIKLAESKYCKITGKFGIESLKDFKVLKRLRKKSDYSKDVIEEAEFNSDFKEIYVDFNKNIDIIIKEIGENVNE